MGAPYHLTQQALADHLLSHCSVLLGAVRQDHEGCLDGDDLTEEAVLHGGDPLALELVVDDCR